jgi:hypothetical protein
MTIKISELPSIVTPTTSDQLPVVQTGSTDKITRGNFLKNIDADATLTDITTNNSSTTKHGFLKKLDNDSTHFMDGQGNWTVPAGSGGYTDEEAQDAVGGILLDSGDIDFTYNDATPSITADVKTSAITPAKLSTAAKTGAITIIIDGGGSEIADGIVGDIEIPFDCTIVAATLLADQSGSIVVDIWKDSYANYPPTDADSITASAPPTISSAVKSQDTTLTGWTTSITAGQTLRFNVDSATTITRVTLSLKVTRT